MQDKLMAPHERFELHEILTIKNLCAVKASNMAKLTQDQELKSILLSDVIQTKQQIEELKTLIMTAKMHPINAANMLLNPTYTTTGVSDTGVRGD